MHPSDYQSNNLLPYDGYAFLIDDFLSQSNANDVFQQLRSKIQWEQKEIIMFGKRVNQPRLIAWHGDKSYTYSGVTLAPLPWTQQLLTLKQQVEVAAHASFNSALLNLYRNGQDSMGWHQDNERSLGHQPIIASVSLGESRKFKFKHCQQPNHNVDVVLRHGSLLIMSGMTQHLWKHCLPKSKKVENERLNITFRQIQDS
jgi:alkylated DNA repair dioxygenase AlkB